MTSTEKIIEILKLLDNENIQQGLKNLRSVLYYPHIKIVPQPLYKTESDDCIRSIEIKVSNPETNWVALDLLNSNVIISEGKTLEEAELKAKQSRNDFILMFVPKNNK